MTKVICIGSATQDIFFPTEEGKVIETPEEITSQRKIAFELGAKYKISERFESLGGCSANVASGLAKQGIETIHYTAIGNDMEGEWIRKKHEELGIGTDLLETCDCKSDLSLIIVDKNTGERTIFHHKEANERFFFDIEKLSGADWAYVGDIFGDWKSIISRIIEKSHSEGISIAFNPRQAMLTEDKQKLFELFGFCKIVFLNKDEALEILSGLDIETGGKEEEYLLREIQKSGVKVAVITDGENGAWAIEGDKVVQVKALKEKQVDSTGAGDAFASGFLAAHIKGRNLEECLAWGVSNGGSVVNYYGGIEGLLDEEKISEKSKTVKIDQFK